MVHRSHGYHMFTSQATDRGAGRVEVWLRIDAGWAPGSVVVFWQSPRGVLLKARRYGAPLLLLSAHPPDSTAGEDAVTAWWEDLRRQVSPHLVPAYH